MSSDPATIATAPAVGIAPVLAEREQGVQRRRRRGRRAPRGCGYDGPGAVRTRTARGPRRRSTSACTTSACSGPRSRQVEHPVVARPRCRRTPGPPRRRPAPGAVQQREVERRAAGRSARRTAAPSSRTCSSGGRSGSGRGVAQDPAPGGRDARAVEVGLGREVVEQQARGRCPPPRRPRRPRGPGSACRRAWRSPMPTSWRRRSSRRQPGPAGRSIASRY